MHVPATGVVARAYTSPTLSSAVPLCIPHEPIAEPATWRVGAAVQCARAPSGPPKSC